MYHVISSSTVSWDRLQPATAGEAHQRLVDRFLPCTFLSCGFDWKHWRGYSHWFCSSSIKTKKNFCVIQDFARYTDPLLIGYLHNCNSLWLVAQLYPSNQNQAGSFQFLTDVLVGLSMLFSGSFLCDDDCQSAYLLDQLSQCCAILLHSFTFQRCKASISFLLFNSFDLKKKMLFHIFGLHTVTMDAHGHNLKQRCSI